MKAAEAIFTAADSAAQARMLSPKFRLEVTDTATNAQLDKEALFEATLKDMQGWMQRCAKLRW